MYSLEQHCGWSRMSAHTGRSGTEVHVRAQKNGAKFINKDLYIMANITVNTARYYV